MNNNKHNEKYYEFIPIALKKLINSYDDNDKFDKYYNQLHAIVPKYGFSLEQLTLILDIIVDPQSSFKNSQKNKLVNLLYCHDLLNFNIVIKILSIFKVPNYYDKKSTIYIISKPIQIKLSNFLIKNFVNIKWEKKFLKILNLLFNLLSIGYLRSNIGLFLIYCLNISNEIDPLYNKAFFFTTKKLNTILEFYEVDQKETIPLLLYFQSYLNSIDRNNNSDLIYSKYSVILSNLKIPKSLFGKVNTEQIEQLLQMKLLCQNEDQINIFENNIKLYLQMVINLNHISSITNGSSKKRKFIDDSSNSNNNNLSIILENFNLHNIYTVSNLANRLITETKQYKKSNILILKYLSTLDFKNLILNDSLNTLFNKDTLFIFYAPILIILTIFDSNNINNILIDILQIENYKFKLTNDMYWIFQSVSNFYKLNNEFKLADCLIDILSEKIEIKFEGSEEEKIEILNISEIIQFLDPDFEKYNVLLTKTLDITFKYNSQKLMRGIVLLGCNWIKEPDCFYKLLKMILSRINFTNKVLLNEFLIFVTLISDIKYSSIDMTKLVLTSDIMSMVFFSNSLFNINLLLQHVLYCKKYFSEYGLKVIESSENKGNYQQLKAIKELHNSYVMDICNILWRDKGYDIKDISSGRFFGFPNEFVEKLPKKSLDLVHLPATKGLFEIEENKGNPLEDPNVVDKDLGDTKMKIFQLLKRQSYYGVTAFLQNSVRGINS